LEALASIGSITRRHVLFDEAHDERNTLSWDRALTIEPEHPDWVYFGKLAATLNDEFVFTLNPNRPLSLELLENYDALMLAAPREAIDAAELESIKKYVANGGGLLVLGDCGLDQSVNILTTSYDITFDPYCILSPLSEVPGNFDIQIFANHAATQRVPFMGMNYGERIILTGAGVQLARTCDETWRDSNGNGQYDYGELSGSFTIAAAYESAQGRVVAVSDNAFHDAGFEWYSNDLFMRSLLRWVTGWHPIYVNDVFLPVVLRK
jgi:hypothetical protein